MNNLVKRQYGRGRENGIEHSEAKCLSLTMGNSFRYRVSDMHRHARQKQRSMLLSNTPTKSLEKPIQSDPVYISLEGPTSLCLLSLECKHYRQVLSSSLFLSSPLALSLSRYRRKRSRAASARWREGGREGVPFGVRQLIELMGKGRSPMRTCDA